VPDIVRYQVSRGDADCALVALSIYLQKPYEDVLGVAARITKSETPHNRGLYTREIKAIASRLGATLQLRRAFDPDEDEGIAGLVNPPKPDHVAFIKRGLVWDTDGTIWELDAYLAATGYRPVSLLVLTQK
jgi:hypothetical protein